jgi:DNA modification methylase
MFSIYNKSSAEMTEIADGSVDLIYTSPPYNIATPYGKQSDSDKSETESYQKLLGDVFSECARILKSDGKLIIEVADTIFTNGKYIQLAGFVQSHCISLGLKIEERHINFVRSENGQELPEHNWTEDYVAEKDTHSNSHQLIVFSKSDDTQFNGEGKILYINYISTKEHPCPTAQPMADFVLKNYYKNGMVVADPFMGTAMFGKEVLRNGSDFIGYETNKTIFDATQKELIGLGY